MERLTHMMSYLSVQDIDILADELDNLNIDDCDDNEVHKKIDFLNMKDIMKEIVHISYQSDQEEIRQLIRSKKKREMIKHIHLQAHSCAPLKSFYPSWQKTF